MLRATLTLACFGAAIGCGSDVVTADDDGGGGRGNGGESGDGAGGAVSDGGSIGDGGAGGAPDVCAGYEDAAEGPPAAIRFRNDAPFDLYLPISCDQLGFAIESADGQDDVQFWYWQSCLQTCEDYQTELPILCEPCAQQTVRLAPGATLDVTWNGLGLRTREMPGSCWADGQGHASCGQKVAAEGQFRVLAEAFESCGDAERCTCDPESNLCFGFPSGLSGTAASEVFSYPTAAVHTVVFDDCTFGCPE